MAILDAGLVLADRRVFPAGYAGSEIIDLGAPGDAVGQELVLHVVYVFNTNSTTTDVRFETSDTKDSDFAPIIQTPVLTLANFKYGDELLHVRVPKGCKRYVRIFCNTAGASDSAIALTAYLSKDL
jgi:hypothetical protein